MYFMINQQAQIWNKLAQKIFNNYKQGMIFGAWGAIGGSIGSSIGELVINPTSSTTSASFIVLSIRVGIWFSIIGAGISIGFLVGYSKYLKRKFQFNNSVKNGIFQGFIAGFIAGAIAQGTYTIIGSTEFLRVICWGIAGGLLGLGLSLHIPNLGRLRGFVGGMIGGVTGGSLFVLFSWSIGEIIGRILGIAAIGFFIGLMIALVETVFRKISLIIHWNKKEQTILSLGKQPILLGSSNNSHIYLSKFDGFHPKTASIYIANEKVIMQYEQEYGISKGMKKLRHELNNGDRRKLGNITIEVKSSI